MYAVLSAATLSKAVCYAACAALASKSDAMLALAEDHLNDIASNLAAVGAAALTGFVAGGWWIDPVRCGEGSRRGSRIRGSGRAPAARLPHRCPLA
jgi:hypothetical protein